jgi:hypothetical protein
MEELNKIWEKEARLLGMNEPEKHEVNLRQIKFIQIVRPALSTQAPENTQNAVPIPPVATTDVAPATQVLRPLRRRPQAHQPPLRRRSQPADHPPTVEHQASVGK